MDDERECFPHLSSFRIVCDASHFSINLHLNAQVKAPGERRRRFTKPASTQHCQSQGFLSIVQIEPTYIQYCQHNWFVTPKNWRNLGCIHKMVRSEIVHIIRGETKHTPARKRFIFSLPPTRGAFSSSTRVVSSQVILLKTA